MKVKPIYIRILLFFLGAGWLVAHGQQPTEKGRKIEIVSESDLTIDQEKYPGATIFNKSGDAQVQFRHQGIDIWCDVAVVYDQKNEVIAFGNVFLQQGDSLKMDSQYIAYNGNLKTAVARQKVVLRNDKMRLETEELFLDRNTQEAYYNNFGTIIDQENTLTSQSGKYYIIPRKNHFTNSVKIVNKDFTVDSQVLDYYHITGNAYLYGATTITGQDYKIFCKRGFYDTRNEQGYFMEEAKIDYDFKTLVGDSLYFDKRKQFSSATNNIVITDTINKTIVKGHYGELHKAQDSMFITRKPLIITLVEKDSMYMHGKKILITGKEKNRVIRAFPDARIFKVDIQAKCDSIHSSEANGLTQLIGRPVAWSGESQMTGDNIHLISNFKTEQMDSLKVFDNAFVVEKDTLGDGYNQVKGKSLYGKFENNRLKRIDFIQNTESIQYVYDDKNQLVGINKLACSRIKLLLDANQQIESVVFITDPSGALYPEDQLHVNERKFREFVWRGDERIRNKNEIFSEEEKKIQPQPIQGLKTPEENDMEELNKLLEIQEKTSE